MAIWDDVIPAEDKAMLDKYRGAKEVGFGERPALLIVDMSYAFVDDRFSSGYSKTGVPCAENIATLLETARERGIPVYYSTNDDRGSSQLMGNWKSRGARAVEEDGDGLPYAHDIYPAVAPRDGETVLIKSKPSVFYGTQLAGLLIYSQIDTVIVTGMSTSGCVRGSVLDAFNLNFKVIVPEECVADRAQMSHKVNLFDMHMKYADVLPMARVADYLRGLE
ncbi:MAG: isochorismatase family protein [bacterium]|nr:isochorismatase family protein [bacterium]